MNKIFIALSLFVATCASSFAYYYEGQLNQVDTVKAQGYGENMAIVMDKVNYQSAGINGRYKRVYSKKYSNNPALNAYEKVKLYFDPCQDDPSFGEHEINYSNTWNRNLPSYSMPMKKGNQVDNL